MAAMNRASVALVLLVGSFLCGASLTRGAVFRVGDDQGWRVGVNYTKWASEKYIVVGDTLVFNYDPSKISRLAIVQVDKMAYDRCDLMEAFGTYRSGNDSVQLTAPGHVYFMTLNTTHCHDGAKLHVLVHNATSADIPAPAKPGPTPVPQPPQPSTGSGPSPAPASTGSSPSPAPDSTESSPSPAPDSTGSSPSPAPDSTGSSPSPASTGPAPAPAPTGYAPGPATTGSGPSPSPASTGSGPSPSPASTGPGPISPPPSSAVSVPSPSPDESPADDSAPAKSGGVILRCSEVVGLVLGLLAVVVMC